MIDEANHGGTVAITGSNGFIGSSLAEYFAVKGWQVLALQRRPPSEETPSVRYHRFSLPDDVPGGALTAADMLVHCAYQPYSRRRRDADEVNRAGTCRLIEICRQHSTKLVFLSTMSAHESALSHYGRHKLELERLFDPSTDLVLKLGLVIGKGGGLFMDMAGAIRRSRLIPLIGGGKQPIQTLAVSDLCEVIHRAYQDGIAGSYALAERDPRPIRELYDLISEKLRLRPVYIPVPFGPVHAVLSALELIGIELPFTTESLLGLKQLRAFDTSRAASTFNIEFMDAGQSIERVFRL